MGWLDVAILGLNVYQSSKLNQAEQQLKLLNAGQLQAALKAELLKMLREIVFNVGQNLQKLEPYISSHPDAVIVATTAMETQLHELGVTPQLFDDFNDKEYISKTFNNLSTTTRTAWDLVTPEQRHTAKTGVQYVKDIPLLTDAIEVKTGYQILQATQPTLQEYESALTRNRFIGMALLLYALAACGLLTLMTLNTSMAACFPITGVISGIAGLVLLTRAQSQEYKDLKAVRATALQQANSISPTSPRWQQIISLFGNQDANSYQRLRNERQNFLENMLAPLPSLGTQGNTQTNAPFSADTPIALPSTPVANKPIVSGDRLVCPHCGHANSQNRLTCKNCRQAIQA